MQQNIMKKTIKRSVIPSPMSCSARWNNAGRGREGAPPIGVLLNTYLCVENVRFCLLYINLDMEMCFVVKRFLEQALRNLGTYVHFRFCCTEHVYTNCISIHNICTCRYKIKNTEDGGPRMFKNVHPSLRLSFVNFLEVVDRVKNAQLQ